jgi:hypothetical protein
MQLSALNKNTGPLIEAVYNQITNHGCVQPWFAASTALTPTQQIRVCRWPLLAMLQTSVSSSQSVNRLAITAHR